MSDNTRRFTGETQDPTGLYYLRARWYDPATGRFLTRDPFPGLAALPQTQHPYVYVGNNPVNLTDPGGEIAPIIVAAGVGAVIGAAGGGVGYVLTHPGGRPEDYLRSGGFRRAVLVGMASGTVSGLVGFGVGGLVSGLPGLGGAIAGGALSGVAASGAGQVTANLLTPCTPWHSGLALAMATGGVTGGIAGGVGYGIGRLVRPAAAEAAAGNVPNPFGRLGGPAHQAKVAEIERDIRFRGFRPKTEFHVPTPGGVKGDRFVDVAALDPLSRQPVEFHQVGQLKASGFPVAREMRAILDILRYGNYPDVPLWFHEY